MREIGIDLPLDIFSANYCMVLRKIGRLHSTRRARAFQALRQSRAAFTKFTRRSIWVRAIGLRTWEELANCAILVGQCLAPVLPENEGTPEADV